MKTRTGNFKVFLNIFKTTNNISKVIHVKYILYIIIIDQREKYCLGVWKKKKIVISVNKIEKQFTRIRKEGNSQVTQFFVIDTLDWSNYNKI